MSTWRYNRMYANRAATPVEKVEDGTIPARIDTLLNNGMINEWEKNFLTSVKAGYQKYNSLTKGQHNTFVGIESRYDAAAIAARNSWVSAWDATKAQTWRTMMEYYKGTPYYRGACDKFDKDPNYIPSESEYKTICENKYAARYLKNQQIPPKFKAGQLVVFKRYGSYHLATVVEVQNVGDWTKGSRNYQIMMVGGHSLQRVAEKEMIYYRESLLPKLEKINSEDTPF